MAFILAKNEEISLVMPPWYDDEHEFFEIVKNDTNEVIGNITMRNEIDSVAGNIEYMIFEEYRGNNYAKKALKLFARNVSNIKDEDLFISILPNNKASIKTAVGSGALFYKVVEIPKNYRLSEDGKYKYSYMYIIKNDRGIYFENDKIK